MELKSLLRKKIEASSLGPPLRNAYQRVCNRDYWKLRQAMAGFYRQFVSRGDLVFDIGANDGLYTEMFLWLGARVVAVEPHPKCVSRLRVFRPQRRLIVAPVAAGSSESEALFFLCAESAAHSSLSTEWLAVARHLPEQGRENWNHTIRVPVTTLDSLINRFGVPSFIKIDVEGFELEVLSGLTHPVACMSFEFITDYLDAAVACLRLKYFSPGARFNYVLGHPLERDAEPFGFALPDWVTASETIEILRGDALRGKRTFGEIFVRQPQCVQAVFPHVGSES
jgi:FkbM family methyltransferase